MKAAILRRSPLAAAAALRQLGQRSHGQMSSDISPVKQIASKTRQTVACSSTRDPMRPDLLAAQAKDAALLAKVAEDLLRKGAANWQFEITAVEYGQALPARRALEVDLDYLSSLALARGSVMVA